MLKLLKGRSDRKNLETLRRIGFVQAYRIRYGMKKTAGAVDLENRDEDDRTGKIFDCWFSALNPAFYFRLWRELADAGSFNINQCEPFRVNDVRR